MKKLKGPYGYVEGGFLILATVNETWLLAANHDGKILLAVMVSDDTFGGFVAEVTTLELAQVMELPAF